MAADDATDILTALSLAIEYEEAKYRLKRAGKGGTLQWKNKEDLEFDVVLDKRLGKLVNIFDQRINSSGNLLSFSGTWAETEGGDDFPLPNDEFTFIHPWPFQIIHQSRIRYSQKPLCSLHPHFTSKSMITSSYRKMKFSAFARRVYFEWSCPSYLEGIPNAK